MVISSPLVVNVSPSINLPMALENLPIAANGLPLVPIGNDMWESQIINESFRQGVFPDNLKVGMVYPIHKVDSEGCMLKL